MKLVKVIGSVTSTIKDSSLQSLKLLLVQTVDINLEDKPDFFVAVDTIGLGEGEICLISTGSTAKYCELTRHKNVDASIIAKVDRIDFDDYNLKS
ncbi:MAG: EutN/CcmL family microcompartment protein [Actinobacteria bacterium]|nr:EutN/CcmL family microcompartment protein [Actinomycetota bacterium]MCL6087925.1 EutN/CcmL family microcompartment protein [Actinomycetota bacterium]